ncbi:MAG: protein phosphatase 2C domain-containing protein [Halobacteriovoraceae bacterium]|nr:protein phosphatase 2C domain-containing protein [Halobacteriovoraceae bacterium]
MNIDSYAAITNQGPFLNLNEDDIEVDLANELYLIFDGIGGVGIGDISVQEVKKYISTFFTRVSGDPDSTLPFFYNEKFTIEGNALLNALHCAHIKLKESNIQKTYSQRGAVSLGAVALSENVINVASVGNCCVKLYKKGKVETLIRPDTLNDISKDDHHHGNLSCPMNALGLFDKLHFEMKEIKADKGDQLILMTDGVYNYIENQELVFILQKDGLNLKEKINELMSLANSRGNLDNQSCIILKF